jgi:hypothetical protein
MIAIIRKILQLESKSIFDVAYQLKPVNLLYITELTVNKPKLFRIYNQT